jgi:hypothetical protein
MTSRTRNYLYKTVTHVGVVPVNEAVKRLETNNQTGDDVNESSPEVWGPKMWFVLHNGAAHYPFEASDIYAEKMKNFILALPIMIPCENCKNHALRFIESRKDKLFIICKKRETLFDFFVDFHNDVNKRQGKKEVSYIEARQIYQNRQN